MTKHTKAVLVIEPHDVLVVLGMSTGVYLSQEGKVGAKARSATLWHQEGGSGGI